MSLEHMNSPSSSEFNLSLHQNHNRVSPPTSGLSRTSSSGCLNENQTKNIKLSQQIDAKLLFHIRKITEKKSKNIESSNNQNSPSITLDYLVNTLLKNHREYKRKYSDLGNFRQLVKIGFDSLSLGETDIQRKTDSNKTSSIPVAHNSNNKNNNNLNKKRKWNEEDSEEISEQEAVQIETLRNSSGGSMLNASIRQRYTEQNKKNARERVVSQSDTTAKVPNVTNENKMPAIVEESNVSTVTSEPTSAIKKKKKKRSTLGSTAKDGTMSNLNLSPVIPKERYADLGGMDKILTQIRELIEYPLLHPELFRHLGVDPPRGVLLRGPPGVGKTHLANAVAGEIGVNFFNISAPEIIGGVSGESEARVRELFQTASISSPSLVFIDEIDAIAPKRGEGKSGGSANSMEKRIVAQLLTCMDSLATTKSSASSVATSSHVMVIGATNRPDAIDPALRRAGRFDREICLGVPDEKARESILKKMSSEMRLEGDFDYKLVAKKTPGFVGADLRSLTKEAAVIAINRIFKTVLAPPTKFSPDDKEGIDADVMDDESSEDKNKICNEELSPPEGKVSTKEIDFNSRFQTLTEEQLAPLYVTMNDFVAAISSVQPSSKREGFATVPDVTWDNIGALNAIRDELTLSVLEPIHHPERFKKLGLPLPAGVMLYGPPGCGKTLLAKAISNESGANFISVKGPELLDKYVGESERAVRQVFERARSSSPCVVFFDELDSLCPKRGSDSGGGGGVSERVVNQLLTEMDGLESRSSVFVIAATNRPELIDPAMLRPGRLDKLLYVPLPTPDDRVSILEALGKKVSLAEDVNLASIARNARASGFSGADCAALLREAGLAVLRDCHGQKDNSNSPLQITTAHFDYAFDHVKPSVSKKDQMKYDRMRDRMARARTRGCALDESRNKKETDSNEATNSDTIRIPEECKDTTEKNCDAKDV